MKIRRILAAAVVAAGSTPALLLSVTPVSAEDMPAAQTRQKPTVAELTKAAAAAQLAYDDAVSDESTARAALEALWSDTGPLVVAAKAAQAAADAATTAKTEADQAAADAEAAVDALPETATDAERTAAATTLTKAEAAAEAAGETKAAADAKAAKALKTLDDERVAAARKLGRAQGAAETALADKTAADEALAKAKKEAADGLHGGDYFDFCVSETRFTAVVTGLPSRVVAGTWVDFRFRVTNGTDKSMDIVIPSVDVFVAARTGARNRLDHLVHLQRWSASSSKWKTLDVEHHMDKISPLKSGAHVDVKMRLTVEASAPVSNGRTVVLSNYWNGDGTCGQSAKVAGPAFVVVPAGTLPGKVDDAEPGAAGPNASDLVPQSGASAGPVSGSLAATGASSATPQLALASGAAVVIGAGAVFAVRRRKDSRI
ncbi:LAETG motif-containing sortase-dependent surface protein [Streptomyces sp. NBC_01013]|uniref:LAETG motif-containing sortase-dependent surface protein n=1 Tax=Streptomyces sp. NBC_01013 TaxID=2903718 RepID=UPI00386AEA3F|nr:peptidase [Streptomyces sp. NBC_01013]